MGSYSPGECCGAIKGAVCGDPKEEHFSTSYVGPETQTVVLPEWLRCQTDLGFIRYRSYSLALIVAGSALMIALWLGFERTRVGARICAAVDNRRMAQSMGVNVGRLFTLTFALGSGLAAVGGGLGAEILGLDPQYPFRYLAYFLIVVAVGAWARSRACSPPRS